LFHIILIYWSIWNYIDIIFISSRNRRSKQHFLYKICEHDYQFFFCVIRTRGMKTRLFSFGGIGYRVSRNSTYFDIYPFTRPVSRTFNQPMIAMGSKQRNVFKKHSIARSIVRSPFEVIECRWPPRKFSKGVKYRDVYWDMSTIQNYSISRKVFSDTFISRSLKGLSYGRLYDTTTSRIPKREVKIMRGTALWTTRRGSMERNVCVTRVTIRIYETCEVGKNGWATNCIIFTSITGPPRWFFYRIGIRTISVLFREMIICLKESKESDSKIQVFF